MLNGLSNFEALKQKISTSSKDGFLKGQQSRVKEVLIVDDEESFVWGLEEGLSGYKKYFNVRTAPNGAEAVKILKLSPIDLVLTDLSMPKMDGFELLAYMNRNYPKIPVILMTAYGTPQIKEVVSNMGIFRYLEKPLEINTITDNIFDALGIKHEDIQKSTKIAQHTNVFASDVQSKAVPAKKAFEDDKAKAKPETQIEGKSKATATFGSRTSLSIEKLREEARAKTGAKVKDIEIKEVADAAEKRAVLEAKAKAEAERIAREIAERKIKEAEERAKQESFAKEEAQRKAREAEEIARQESLAKEEAQRKVKEAEEKAKQEALAREEAIKKAKSEAEAKAKAEAEEKARQEEEKRAKAEAKAKAEAEEKAREEAEKKAKAEEKAKKEAELKAKEEQSKSADKEQKDLKKETEQKLSAWKKR
jgi:CheY-like chemotaxis protein